MTSTPAEDPLALEQQVCSALSVAARDALHAALTQIIAASQRALEASGQDR